MAELTARLDDAAKDKPGRQAGGARPRGAFSQKIGANRADQKEPDDRIRTAGNDAQFWQETGGLVGRIILAVLLVVIVSRRRLLRIFQVPGLVAVPAHVLLPVPRAAGDVRLAACSLCGLCTVAQFSYFGEYLPKVFPVHLRGTGGSFATNVGGRMVGTSASFVTTSVVAPLVAGGTSLQVATAAAVVGGAVYLVGLALSFFLPEPPAEANRHERRDSRKSGMPRPAGERSASRRGIPQGLVSRVCERLAPRAGCRYNGNTSPFPRPRRRDLHEGPRVPGQGAARRRRGRRPASTSSSRTPDEAVAAFDKFGGSRS